MAALAPMPNARVSTTAAVNPGLARSPRAAYRKSCRNVSSMVRWTARTPQTFGLAYPGPDRDAKEEQRARDGAPHGQDCRGHEHGAPDSLPRSTPVFRPVQLALGDPPEPECRE